MPFSTLLLAADDLTGAADCAAYAPGVGLPAAIHVAPLPMLFAQGLHAFSTNSRALAPDAARRALRAALLLWPYFPGARCFKKIDSLLRGNVGAEVEAMLAGLHVPVALICPALPAQGRSVVEGRLVGAPVAASVEEVLAAQTSLPQAHISLAEVQGNRSRLKRALAAAAARAPLVIADAQNDADLDALVVVWRAAVPDGLLCGSAGLAAAWLRARASKRRSLTHPAEVAPPIDLVVAGSASAMAHAQIAAAAALPGVQVLEVAGGALPNHQSGYVLLHLPRPLGVPTQEVCAAAAAALADAALISVQRAPVQHLLVVGGDTAQALLPRLGVTRLEVVLAQQPGIPTCRAIRTAEARLWVTLKAGNHGHPDTIAGLMQR